MPWCSASPEWLGRVRFEFVERWGPIEWTLSGLDGRGNLCGVLTVKKGGSQA